jgi:hypothetical protein
VCAYVYVCVLRVPKFVYMRSGKTCRHGHDCQEGSSLYSPFSGNRKQSMPHRKCHNEMGNWSGGLWARAFVVSVRWNKQGRAHGLRTG